jgi:hypothetical protein
MEHERSLTRELLEHLKPLVLVAVGAKPLQELGKFSTFDMQPPKSIEAAVGLTFSTTLRTGHSMIVCPVKRLTAAWPHSLMTHEQKQTVGRQIREALLKSL